MRETYKRTKLMAKKFMKGSIRLHNKKRAPPTNGQIYRKTKPPSHGNKDGKSSPPMKLRLAKKGYSPIAQNYLLSQKEIKMNQSQRTQKPNHGCV